MRAWHESSVLSFSFEVTLIFSKWLRNRHNQTYKTLNYKATLNSHQKAPIKVILAFNALSKCKLFLIPTLSKSICICILKLIHPIFNNCPYESVMFLRSTTTGDNFLLIQDNGLLAQLKKNSCVRAQRRGWVRSFVEGDAVFSNSVYSGKMEVYYMHFMFMGSK